MQRGRGYRHRNVGNRRDREPPIEDLREKLNRMKLEKEMGPNNKGVKNPPPPDPSYNFLKDPLRGDNYAQTSNEKKVGNKSQNNKPESKVERKETDNDQKSSTEVADGSPQRQRSVRFNEDVKAVPISSPRRGGARPNWRTPYSARRSNDFTEKNVQKPPKQQSVHNIKVELSNESGERKCTFDESKTVEVPVMPKTNYTVRPRTGRWQYRGPQRYYSGRYNRPRVDFSTPNRHFQQARRDNRRNYRNNGNHKNKNETENKDANKDDAVAKIDENKEEKADAKDNCNEETKAESKAETNNSSPNTNDQGTAESND